MKRLVYILVAISLMVGLVGVISCGGGTTINDDAEFTTWLANTNDNIHTYRNNVLDAVNNDNWYSLEYYSETEADLIDNTYKPQCLAFHLSSKYDSIRDEYNEFLYDISWACFYDKWIAKDMQDGFYSDAIDDFDKATDYVNRATVHLNRVTSMVNELG
jgi:hypothetical protein